MKTCKTCGNIVKEIDNFCSNCGTPLSFEIEKESEGQVNTSIIKIRLCDLCGEENDYEAKECDHCGVRFSGKEKLIERTIKVDDTLAHKEPKIVSVKKSKPSKQKRQETIGSSKQTSKTLSTKHIYLILASFIGLLAIFIYLSYENAKVSVGNNNLNTGSPVEQSSVDLNAINEINRLENELKNEPNNPDILIKLANLTHDAQFFEKAISYYEKYLTHKPDDNDAEVDMGVCYFELKQFDKARKIFESVIEKNPRHQIAYLNLGVVFLREGKTVEAKENFQKCIALGEHTNAGHRAAELLKSH